MKTFFITNTKRCISIDSDPCNYESSLEFWFENRPNLDLKHNFKVIIQSY